MVNKIILDKVSEDGIERRGIRVSTTKIPMRTPVKLLSTGLLGIAGNAATGSLSIGVADFNADYAAVNGTTDYAAGDMATVLMTGRTYRTISGGTYDAGVYVKYNAAGNIIAEATATTKTVATEGIALEASTASGQEVLYVKQ